jgi:hypothetical protein
MIGQKLDADPPIGRLISDYSHPPDASLMLLGTRNRFSPLLAPKPFLILEKHTVDTFVEHAVDTFFDHALMFISTHHELDMIVLTN